MALLDFGVLFKKKIKLFKTYNQYYYDKSSPLVSDQIYDQLKKKILDLELEFNFLKSQDSPSEIVGFKPSKNFKKINHKVEMLSLGNAFSENDLLNFEKKILNYLGKDYKFNLTYNDERCEKFK